MSAIAFYDSGRLLPYRHDLKQKQIEQRNVDAENTRKYIGYAGGAFANMAERTGTIFGARLGSAPQTTDPMTGETVDVPQKYGGGTTGAEYAKADWQKGMMNSENHRRDVTHKLGLLTENVKYATLIRKREAWGDIDPVAGKEEYKKKWEQYMEDVKTHQFSKIELMERYSDLFPKEARKQIGNINLMPDGDAKEALIKKLDSYIPYSRFMTYATENGMYDPTVAGRSQPEVDLLMAFLKDEVKFPGMKGMIADREKVKEKKVAVDSGNGEDGGDLDLDLEALRKIKDQKKKALEAKNEETTSSNNNSNKIESNLAKTDTFFGNIFNEATKLLKDSTPAGKLILSLENKKKLEGEARYEGNKKERLEGLGNFEGNAPSLPSPVDWNIAPPPGSEEESIMNDHLGNSSFEESFKNIPTVNSKGEKLRPEERAMIIFNRVVGTMKFKLFNNVPIWSGKSGAQTYEGAVSDEEKLQAGQLIKNKLKEVKNQAIHQARVDGTDGGEGKVALGKIQAAFNKTMGYVEANFAPKSPLYKGKGGLDYIEWQVEEDIKRLTQPKVAPSNNTASMVSSSTDLNADPADLSAEEHYAQAIKHTIIHEDPDLSGRIIDDNTRAILGGSVDAWEIVDKDPKQSHHLISNVLNIKDRKKARAFVDYFNAKDMDSHLGHIKKDKNGRAISNQPDLTPLQMDRRRDLKLTPDQTKALVAWAYDNNLKILTKNHGFLNQAVYKNNPSLHQLLGDMAYRHGGSFMTMRGAGYAGLAEALNYALNPTMTSKKFNSREDAIAEMDKLLFGQGTYGENNKKVSKRYKFLKNRFNRFKDNTTGANVATEYKGKKLAKL